MDERRTSAGLGPAEVRRLCAQVGLSPSKRLGQNFVHDANTVRRIVRESGVGPDDLVLEVGPGLGSLTLPLLQEAAGVVAVELDARLAALLPRTVAQHHGPERAATLTVLTMDALRVTAADLAGAAGRPPDVLVANLPYNVSVPVVLHLLAEVRSLRGCLVMVQAEVADRLTAAPGSRTYGAPSVKVAWFAEASPAGRVPRSVFWPVPNVDSALVRLARRDRPATTASPAEVFSVVDAAFAQRRKMLRSALAPWAGGPQQAAAALSAAGIDPSERGERLSVAQFARLAECRPGR